MDSTVAAISPAERQIELEGGEVLEYEALVLATGAKVRRLDLPGADLAGIHYLRTIDDCFALRDHLSPGARLAIVGGGYIGLEVASVARGRGAHVTVLEAEDRVMARVVAPVVSRFFEDRHRALGVEIELGATASGFVGTDGKVAAISLTDGREIACDLALVGVGIAPETKLAETAGLEVDDGILVDEYCLTSDPHIRAVGDCTRHKNLIYPDPIRLESVHNAMTQAQIAAAAVAGKPNAYDEVPWFWSEQAGLRLQIAGLQGENDEIRVAGDVESGAFAAYHFRSDRLVAVDAVAAAKDFMKGRKLIGQGADAAACGF